MKSLRRKSPIYRIFVILIYSFLVSTKADAQCDYLETAESVGLEHSFKYGTLGGGVSFVDFNEDGWDDLTFTTSYGEPIHFYINNSGIFQKTDIGVYGLCEAKQVIWVDFDNDGDKDFFYTCLNESVVLFENTGNLTMVDITSQVGLSEDTGFFFGANWIDIDRDGWLDLYIADYGSKSNRLYKNINGEYFEDITITSQSNSFQKVSFCAIAIDYDQDGWEDIYIANDRSSKNNLLRNINGQRFEDVSMASKSDLPMDAMGLTTFDINDDEYFEIYISNSPAGNALLFNLGNGTFDEIAEESGIAFNSVGWGVCSFDFNNDTFQDIYVSGSLVGNSLPSSALYQGTDESLFNTTSFSGMSVDTLMSFGNAVGDFNSDGYLDIAVNNSNETNSQLWANECSGNNWLRFNHRGVISNRDGIGAVTSVFFGEKITNEHKVCGSSYLSQDHAYEHVGIGSDSEVDSVIITWPSGVVDKLYNVTPNQIVNVVEGQTLYPFLLSGGEKSVNVCSNDGFYLVSGLYGLDANYLWSDDSTNDTLIISESGDYWLQIERDGHYIYSDTVKITYQPSPSLTAEVQIENNLANVSLTAEGGVPPYEFSWFQFPGYFESFRNEISAGDYSVEVIDSNGCTDVISFNVQVVTGLNENLEKIISISQNGIEIKATNSNLFPLELNVFNISGNLLQSENITSSGVVEIQENYKGQILILTLSNDNEYLVQKIRLD